MDFDWELLQKANEEKDRIQKAFKDRFFSKEGSYFHGIETDVDVSATETIIKTNYNSYKFRRKQDGTFIFKKDKLEQYFYSIDASYTIDTWKKGLEAAKKDFEEIMSIKDEIISYLENSSKATFGSSIKKFYDSIFGKKDEPASLELKEEQPKPQEETKEDTGNELTEEKPKDTEEKKKKKKKKDKEKGQSKN